MVVTLVGWPDGYVRRGCSPGMCSCMASGLHHPPVVLAALGRAAAFNNYAGGGVR